MPAVIITAACDIVLYYHLVGNNNKSNPVAYRPDNPWKKLNALRDELSVAGSALAATMGIQQLYSTDDSVWRIVVTPGFVPAAVATNLLNYIDTVIVRDPGDVVFALAPHTQGPLFEAALL